MLRARLYSALVPHKVFPYKHYYFSTNLKLIYLAIPKNANSFFRVAFFMNSDNAADFRPQEESAVEYLRRTRRGKLRIPNLRVLDDPGYTRMVILRNPMNRLVSAYIDKFVKTVDRPPEPMQRYIREAGLHLSKALTPSSFTFADFLHYTIALDDAVIDDHWRPQANFVNGRTFDFYGDVEHIEPTYAFFRDRYGIDVAALRPLIVSAKRTPYQGQKALDADYSEATPAQLNSLDAYPQAARFYTSRLLDLFMNKYGADVDLYTTTLGRDRDDLLGQYV